MQINSYTIPNQPTFTHYAVKKNTDNYGYYTSTAIFRGDLDWDGLMNLMKQKYKDTDKVNVICHACSDGEEAYSMALKLHKTFGKDSKKFLPIVAQDIDYDNIRLAKRGNYVVSDTEINRLEQHSGLDVYRYFDIYDNEFSYEKYAKPKDFLKEMVDFKQGNILDDIENIPKENTVLMCRNFWPYLPGKSQTELAQKLGKQLAPSSLLVLGEFDMRDEVLSLLRTYGFEQTDIPFVFQKANL